MSSSTVWKVWGGFSYRGNCESYHGNRETEWTAFDGVEPGHLPERVARSVVKTTVSLPSCQQAQSTSWQCRRSLTKSISEEMPYFTGLTVTRSPAWNVRRTRVATESRSRQKRHVSYENTAATAAVQHRARADGWSLRGRPTPLRTGAGRGGVRADTPS